MAIKIISGLTHFIFGRLRFPYLVGLAAVLFILSFFDPIPFVDEILFGVLTLIIASFKKKNLESTDAQNKNKNDRVIEHEKRP